MKREHKRSGFTLIEVIVTVFIIIAIGGTMFVASQEAFQTARANEVVNNMNILKAAVIMWYKDNPDHVYYNGNVDSDMSKIITNPKQSGGTKIHDALKNKESNRKLISRYIDDGDKLKFNTGNNKDGEYEVLSTGKQWFVSYKLSSDPKNRVRVREKLTGRAITSGLLKEAKTDSAPYSNGDYVYMEILNLDQ